MICDRSPDGQKIAYVSEPTGAPGKNSSLHWFSLTEPESGVRQPLSSVHATHLAFAPDSLRMAVFGYDELSKLGAIYILELESGDYRLLLYQGNANSMLWSPDGEYLAFIGRGPGQQFSDEVIVMHVNSGQITNRSPVDYESNKAHPDWIDDRGIEFPVDMGGLEACSIPDR
jgi:Tol biopolymer transport system component